MKLQIFVLFICVVLSSSYIFYGDDYQRQKASQKLDQLWEEITADQTPYGWYSPISIAGIFVEGMKPSFDYYSDEMPEFRKKLIHSVGAVAKAEFIAEPNSPYTGIFKGATNALVRISCAKEPDSNKDPLGNFMPGLGLKLLRDKTHSANIVAMLGDTQDSWNTFKYDWSNHIQPPKSVGLKLLAKKFTEATPHVTRMGLKTWGKFDQTGTFTDDEHIKIPYKLIFSPHWEASTLFPDHYSDVFTNQLLTIKSGTRLFNVMAEEEPGSKPVQIGTLKTTSKFVTSKFGDQYLFFQHNYMDDDIALHPNWKEAVISDPSLVAEFLKEIHSDK